MPRIQVLPDALVNRIAAGEVVERPASVVKELIENSLDAGATRIEVELVQGGRSLIRVSDDGRGMDADDALLCLERHATSKISVAEDLERIGTLGFRGEALPSIAAVSSFTLTSCSDPQSGGARVTVENGRILGVEGVARARGTTVEVSELFRGLPARRKFLHAPETELRHAQEVIVAAALARIEVAFTLRHGGRVLIDVAPATDHASRFEGLFRRRITGSPRRFEATSGSSN
ncbi:MAG: DNA mismatch repair protein MutL, partial [bacterium]|nr:DNA mismatch repair protein MutL [bacterium]